MAKTTKTTTSAPAKETVTAAAPVKKTTTAKKTKAAPKVAKEEVVVSTPDITVQPADVENTVVSAAPETVENQLAEQSLEFIAKLQQLSGLINSLKSEYRLLEKKWTRELKTIQKLNSKKKRKMGNRAPSGFVKPTKISLELSTFLGKPSGCEMARTEVTREINKYIRSNNLQDKTNGRKIIPDAKLTALLNLKKTDELTYFNLQRYMSPHFEKSTPKVTA